MLRTAGTLNWARGARASLLLLAALGFAPHLQAQVLLSACWADTLQAGDPDEAVEIWNGGGVPVDITGYVIADDDGGAVVLPAGASLEPDERFFIARDAQAFRLAFGASPAFELAGSDANVPDVTGTWPQLANAGDEVRLSDSSGALVDVLVFGNALPSAGGWTGGGATTGWDPAFGSSQLLITRDRLESSSACLADTDTSDDWDDLRLVRPGTTFLRPATFPDPGRVTVAIGPDATLDALASVIEGATTSLRLGIYYVSNPAIVDLLLAAIARGVNVRVLLEGQLVGGRSDGEKWAGATLTLAGADVRWLRADTAEVKRYPFHHAKYIVADDLVTYVATENAGETGHPVDASFGNRGWAVRVDDPRLAAWHAALFDNDSDLSHADVKPHDPSIDDPTPGYVPDAIVPAGWHAPVRAPFTPDDVVAVSAVVSPDHTSLATGGILGLLASATETLDIEQLSMPTHWGMTADPPDLHPSPFVQGILEAARRGVRVRVLLDGSWYSVEGTDPRDNDDTCALLNQAAATEGLPLACRILDPDWLNLNTIHVKGLLVDSRIAHVGSTNGTSNSFRLNREAGLQIESASAVQYFTDEFDRDWFVAGVEAQVPVEVQNLRVSKSPAGLSLSWDAPLPGTPAVSGYIARHGAVPSSEAGWAIAGESATISLDLAMPVASPLAFLLVVAQAEGPGGRVEGPSGHFDGYFDR